MIMYKVDPYGLVIVNELPNRDGVEHGYNAQFRDESLRFLVVKVRLMARHFRHSAPRFLAKQFKQ